MHTPITYYGGKQQLVSTILGMIPSHRVYVEPYFGGGALFFAKGKSYLEVINDIDDRLITFYNVCHDKDLFPLLVDKINISLNSETLFRRAVSIWNDVRKAKDDVDLAWAVWYSCNMGYGGSPSGGWKWDNGTSGSHIGVVMDNYRQQFSNAIHERLKYVQISCRDALKVISQRDGEDTFFFLDPPYPGCDQKHYKGFSEYDFEELLKMLTGIKGKFILCNYDSRLLRRYVKQNRWHVTVKDMALRVANRVTGGRKRKQEVMVYNYVLQPSLFE